MSWDALETRLDARAAGKKRRVAIWWSVAAASLLGGSFGVWFFNNNASVSAVNAVATQKQSAAPSAPESVVPEVLVPVQAPQISAETSSLRAKHSVIAAPVMSSRTTSKKVGTGMNQSDAVSEANVSLLAQNTPEAFVLLQDFNGATLKKRPFSFEFLQSSLNIHPSQKPTNRQLSRWAFEVGYDQNQTAVTYRTATGMEQYVHKNYLNHMKQSEVALSASQAHLAVRYQLSPNWIISAGLGWMQNRTQQNFQFTDSMPFSVSQGYEADAYGNYPIFGYLTPGPRANYSGISNISMLSLPLGMIWEKSLTKRVTVTAEALIQANYLSLRKGNTLNYHYLTLQDIGGDTYRNLLWSAKFGAGLQRELSRQNAIGARVNAQGMITPLFKSNTAVENRGWSIGLSAYYVWRFN